MTLRGRLSAMVLATLLPVVLLVGGGLYIFVRATVTARFDDGLRSRAEALIAATRVEDGTVEFDFAGEAMPQYERAGAVNGPWAAFELYRWSDSGQPQLVERSGSLGDRALVLPPHTGTEGATWNAVESGRRIRVMSVVFAPHIEHEAAERDADDRSNPSERDDGRTTGARPRMAILVAASREPLEEPLEALAIGLAGAAALMALAAVFGVRVALARGLRPVDRLGAAVQAIDANSLGAAVDAGALPAEIAPIQARLNELLARLKSAFDRERRFSAAAAHELRTPVAELRTLLEVASSRPRTAEESSGTIARSLASAERLDRLVSALMRLARIEGGREPVRPQAVLLLPLVDRLLKDLQPLAAQRRVSLAALGMEGLVASCDEELFALALRNLLRNIVDYADEGSAAEVSALSEGVGLIVRATNAASTLSDADAEKLGEPLWRSDASRTRADHIGLGITLARAAIEAQGGSLEVQVRRGPSGTVVVATVRIAAQVG